MGRPPKIKPIPAVPTADQQATDAVREPIKQMSGFATAEEMEASLPANTMTPPQGEEKPRRGRRTKAEIEAARGGQVPIADPLLNDPEYKKAIADMQAFGGSGMVNGGFSLAAKISHDDTMALSSEEKKRFDGFFYVMSKKYTALDPSGHWFTMLMYFAALLVSSIGTRFVAKKSDVINRKLGEFFGFNFDDEDKPEGEEK